MRLKDKQTGEIDEYLFSNKRGDADSVGLNKGDDIDNPIFFNSLAELCERFEDVPEGKKYGGRVPKEGDTYWFISSTGAIIDETWTDAPADHHVFQSGSAFWTKEEAEKELARRKVYVILKEDTKGFKPDWKGELALQHKYTLYYSYNDGSLYIDNYPCYQTLPNDLIFASREDAEASIKAHEKEWKTWLGVEE